MKPRTILGTISILYAVLFYIAFKSPIRIDDQALVCLSGLVLTFCGLTLLFVNFFAIFLCKSFIPLIVLLAAVVVAWYMPGLTPEELYFARYKSDYEHVIEMARKQQLQRGGNCYNAFVRPPDYKHLTIENCFYVEYSPALTVEFKPKLSSRVLVFAETEDALKADASCWGNNGWVVKEINENWYVCYQTWN